jgi:hypothetical protein
MSFQYHHLEDVDVRRAMTTLWEEENETLVNKGLREQCYGADLIEAGWVAWESAMPQALAEQDDDWLIDVMLDPSYWRSNRPPTKPGYKPPKVSPKWASKMLCSNEFNAAYVRGVASALLAGGETECVVYRADTASDPRCECTEWEGRSFPLQQVLDGHRARYWPDDSNSGAFSVPSGVNCHHSIHAVGVV